MMGKHILAVDDNPLMLEVYGAVLGAAGYEVATAGDGLQALEYLERQLESPDLVLLDVDMPRMTGWELLEIMRRRVEWHEVPVIMVSALIEPPAEELQQLPVFQCYVTKKETGTELVELVRSVLDGSYQQQPQCQLREPPPEAAAPGS